MLKIYRESFRFFRRSFPVLLLIGAMIEILLWVLQPKSETAATTVALVFLAYYFHRHFLFGEAITFRSGIPSAGAPPLKFGWFILLSLALIFLPVGVALALTLGLVEDHSQLTLLLFLLPIYLLALSLFGTALPATVARDGTYRLVQGLRATLSTMWRLILGPGVVGLVLITATIAAGYAIASSGIAEDSPVVLVHYILIRTFGFLSTILAVAVLCEMYRRTRPEPHAMQGSDPTAHRPA